MEVLQSHASGLTRALSSIIMLPPGPQGLVAIHDVFTFKHKSRVRQQPFAMLDMMIRAYTTQPSVAEIEPESSRPRTRPMELNLGSAALRTAPASTPEVMLVVLGSVEAKSKACTS